MKGQLFIIAAIFILIGVILIHGLLSVYDLFEESRSINTLTLDAQVRNIAREYEYATGIASLNLSNNDANATAMRYLANFSQLVRSDTESSILYALIFVNGSTSNYSVTIGNYLGDQINMTVNATGSTPAGSSFVVADRANGTARFNSSAGARTITLTYTLRNATVAEAFALNITSRNALQIFYDIELRSSQALSRAKALYNTTW